MNIECSTDQPAELSPAEAVLQELIDIINDTGGLVYDEDENLVPAADREWIDLAETYLSACQVMNREPQMPKHPPSIEVEEEVLK